MTEKCFMGVKKTCFKKPTATITCIIQIKQLIYSVEIKKMKYMLL